MQAPHHRERMSFRQIMWSFNGRINRPTFFILWVLTTCFLNVSLWVCLFGSLILFGSLTEVHQTQIITILVAWVVVYVLIVVWPCIAIIIKRLHDTNRSGWMCLLALVPLVNLWLMVCMFLPGTQGSNSYGPQP